ncbi:hypothetical protein [Nonomuraea sp. bgisy101]|uniref:hypothetical protein n=1 Tax=Nonomuraea sp. bgisy101 TaxID=3413784 RepID=UPI003D716599
MARHGTGEPENAWNQGGRDSEDPREADFRSFDDPIATGAFMAPVADQAGWPAPPDQIDQQFQAGPSTGEWAMPPQQPDVPGGPATGPMSAHDAFGGPVSAFGGGPSAGGPSPFDDRGTGGRGFEGRRGFDDGDYDDAAFGDHGFRHPGHSGSAFAGSGHGGPALGDPGHGSAFGDPGHGGAAFGDPGHGGAAFGDPGFGEPAAGRGPGHQGYGDAAFGGSGTGEPPSGGTPYGGQGFDDAAGPAMAPTAVHSSPNDRLVATGPPRQPVAAWEEAPEPNETAFLGSAGWGDDNAGWDDDPEDKSSRRRRGRRRPDAETREPGQKGRGKIALLSVAAVAIVLGGTVVGVRMVSSSGEAPKAGAVSSSKPAPSVSETAEPEPGVEVSEPATDDGAVAEPTEEPSEEPSATKVVSRPRPTATAAEREPRRTTTPRPTTRPTKPPVIEDGDPTEEPTPSADPSNMQEADATGQPGVPDPVTSSTSGTGSGSGSTGSGGAAVNVTFDVVRQRLAGYTAELQVVNESARALTDWTVSVPVVGTVSAVQGAQWMQDGGLLVIQPGTTLAAGESVQVTFTALGRPDNPESCGLVGGECTVG